MYNTTVEHSSRIRSGSNMAGFYAWRPYKSFFIIFPFMVDVGSLTVLGSFVTINEYKLQGHYKISHYFLGGFMQLNYIIGHK